MSTRTADPTLEPNLQILANAGSGKTHTLVTRIIALLARKVDPRKIIALTFTRKAAGEFLSKLLQRLADASLDPKKAIELSKATGVNLGEAEYRNLLQQVVEELGRLQLTTFDSFFNSVVSSFPQELGLTASPELLDPPAEKLAGKKALRKALSQLDRREQDLFIQSLFERDDAAAPISATGEFARFREELYETFLDHPDQSAWGHPEAIWGPNPYPWKSLDPENLQSSRKMVEAESVPEKIRNAWSQLLDLRRGQTPKAVVQAILSNLEEWKKGSAKLLYSRKEYEISPQAQKAAAALVEHFINESTEYRLKEARVVHQLLSHYHQEYDAEVRGRGMLTFSDVTALLQPGSGFEGIALGGKEGSKALQRLRLDERLDARFDHWLLDEFQDTSRSQFRAMGNILDEVISEAARGGERSFFCVGDIKQAIYGWRKGDARLFNEIYEHYKGGMKQETLQASWRSSQAILDLLNEVFGKIDSAVGIPEKTKTRWENAWASHQRAEAAEAIPGYASWITSTAESKEERDEEIRGAILSLLDRMKSALESGMTIAMLVESNNDASQWVQLLRENGLEALSESNPPVGRDNPVAAAIRSAFSLMAHPGDQFSKVHLSMEPLRGILFKVLESKNDETDLEDFLHHSAKKLVEGGFAKVMEWVLGKFAPLIRDDFSKERAASLRRAAIKADGLGITDIDEFLSMLEGYEEPGRSAPHAIQVMTIHKSKGLEYDMVILPVMGVMNGLDSLRNDKINVWQKPDENPFLLMLPSEAIRKTTGNAPLQRAVEIKKTDAVFEELCVWYVAMSRARRALYIFSHEPSKPSKANIDKCPSFPHFLIQMLDEKRNWGDPNWANHFIPKPPEADPDPLPRKITVPSRAAALEKYRPSDESHESLPGLQAFSEKNAVALGASIHELFESIEWLDHPWSAPSDCSKEAAELMGRCLGKSAMKKLFTKPPGETQVWREKHFDLLIGDHWLSGCFDRVVIHRDSLGAITGADLIDYKTDQATREELLAKHGSQLRNYQEALSRLLKIPKSLIRTILIQVRAENPVMELNLL